MARADETLDLSMLRRAALAGLRGRGLVEPNPAVGCVIGLASGEVLGIGHHEHFGGSHAEVRALANAQSRGRIVRGATAWVTLEPCAHQGKTPPCTRALIEAGIARVVTARPDPNPLAAGGGAVLRAAGVEFELVEGCKLAGRLSAPWITRLATGTPWVIAKWAQTLDGKVATSGGESKWISGPGSRRAVHRLRGRVDVVLTGIGTVLKDDPRLTARGVAIRRVARRAVIDPGLRTPTNAALVASLDAAPLTVFCEHRALVARGAHRAALERAGVEVVALHEERGGEFLRGVLRQLSDEHEASNVLVEAGPTLNGSLIRHGLIDEVLVFVAPLVMGDPSAPASAAIGPAATLHAARRLVLQRAKRLGDDVMLRYAPITPRAPDKGGSALHSG